MKTLRNDDFCLYDSGSNDSNRIIIFTTERNLVHIKNSNLWISDGTFKVVPNEFLQLYTIHGKVFNSVFPLIYVLMRDKYEKSYSNVLEVIRKQGGVDFPKNIVIDFEIAAYNAFKTHQTAIFISVCSI